MSPTGTDNSVLLFGVGDVGPIHEPLSRFRELVTDTIKTADIRFAQSERTYSERGYMQVNMGGHNSRQHPKMAEIFWDTGFNVVSLASNHAMDWGVEALLDTRELFEQHGIQVIGAGRNSEEARRPAIFEINGVRVGLLAYTSVARLGCEATAQTAGVAPIRVHTYYEAPEYQPGIPPRVVTVPYEQDIRAMGEDIKKTLETVDTVIVSMHWGIHNIPKMLADYEHIAAQAAFDFGASMILGHHPHVPKAIEVIDGKVCFHSLGNFMFTTTSRAENRPGHVYHDVKERYGIEEDPDYPTMPYGKDGWKSMIARAIITKAGPQRVSLYPVYIDKQIRAEILKSSDPRFNEAIEYLERLSSDVKHEFHVEGDELVIVG